MSGDHEPVRPGFRSGNAASGNGRERVAPATPQSEIETISVTCRFDHRAHAVPDDELAEGVVRRGGYCKALCGHMIAVAPMVMPDGKPCPLCAAAQDSNTQQRRGWLRRLLG
ncbi:MAG: hypothetical protein ACRDRH_21855 [Pseudonocardia sp.]